MNWRGAIPIVSGPSFRRTLERLRVSGLREQAWLFVVD